MKYKPTKWGLKLGVLAYMSGDIRDRNMRKETISCISEFSVLNAYNLESIVATDFNFGVKFLTSSCYTRKKFCATSTSSMDGASSRVNRIQKLLFYASLWQFTIRYRRLTLASNVGSVK